MTLTHHRHAIIALLATLLVASVGLAGCLSADDDGAADDPGVQRAEVTQDTGGVEGVVIDNAVQPIGGANVTAADVGATVQAGSDGAFALSNLPPGQLILVASAPGFHSVQKQVTVRAGEVATVEFTLTRVTVQAPYVDKLEFAGYQECATRVGYDVQDVTGREGWPSRWAPAVSWCSVPNSLLGGNATNDRFIHVFRVSPGVGGAVFEAEWQASNPNAGDMTFITETPPFYGNGSTTWAYEVGESPMRWEVPGERIAGIDANLTKMCEGDGGYPQNDDACGRSYRSNGDDVSVRAFPWWTCMTENAGMCNNIQQSFTVYVSVFYHQEIPEGYTIRGGA